MNDFGKRICQGIPDRIPDPPLATEGISHAPARPDVLSPAEKELAVSNALRYFPREWHAELAREFAEELKNDGRIYMKRFRPAYEMKARPLADYPARTPQAAAVMLMI